MQGLIYKSNTDHPWHLIEEVLVNCEDELNAAISNAVRVENQEVAKNILLRALNWNPHSDEHRFEPDKVYPVEVRYEILEVPEYPIDHTSYPPMIRVARLLPSKEETREKPKNDMKDIKPYLPFYYGLECEITIRSKRMVHEGWEDGRTIINGYLLDCSDDCIIKPILRSLSDMSEEEENYMVSTQDDVRLDGFPQIRLKADSGETFRWLLSKGFDLFGLIDSGLAIDQKTINQ